MLYKYGIESHLFFICRWNFSVGQHDLSFLSENIDCHREKTPNNFPDEYELKVIVPEGLVCSVNKKTGEIVWKYKVREILNT